jgi:hypothetical protein
MSVRLPFMVNFHRLSLARPDNEPSLVATWLQPVQYYLYNLLRTSTRERHSLFETLRTSKL